MPDTEFSPSYSPPITSSPKILNIIFSKGRVYGWPGKCIIPAVSFRVEIPSMLLCDVLAGQPAARRPIWLMRQAGRYLPEYLELRKSARDFLNFCYTPDMATEATLQPIRRFGFDAAIIFSDILVIPDALGIDVKFVPGTGPVLETIKSPADIQALTPDAVEAYLQPVYAALRQTRAALPDETALIGFAGAPWTLAAYMVEGSGSRDYAAARKFAVHEPAAFMALIGLLETVIADHLIRQIDAGAQIVQIFDSWAGALPAYGVEQWSLGPIQRIAGAVKAARPDAYIIAFPRGADSMLEAYAATKSIDAVSCGQSLPAEQMARVTKAGAVPQGNLDPMVLVKGGDALDREIRRIMAATEGQRHIFNLGHGITPDTPTAHVEHLIETVRGE